MFEAHEVARHACKPQSCVMDCSATMIGVLNQWDRPHDVGPMLALYEAHNALNWLIYGYLVDTERKT